MATVTMPKRTLIYCWNPNFLKIRCGEMLFILQNWCLVFSLFFPFLQPMLEHMRDVHGQELQSFPCPVDGCTSVYLQRFEMEDHVKKGRHSIKKTCEKCGVVSQVIMANFLAMRFSDPCFLSFGHTQRDTDPILLLCIRFTKPLYWWEKGGRDCGRLRRFGDSDTKYQVQISNQLCVAEALSG